MMRKYKGIVCEKKATYSVFLTEDGEFLRGTPINAAVQIGEEAEFHLFAQATAPKRMKPIVIAPALIAAMLLITLVASWFPETTPAYAYIQVEGDSTIEIGVDEDGKVISLHSTAGVMEDWEGQSVDFVLAKAIEQVSTEKTELAVTTLYEKENKPKLKKQIEEAVKQVQKAKPSSEKNSVEPKQKNLKPETKPPGQIKKEEKLPNPNKPAINKEQKGKPTEKTDQKKNKDKTKDNKEQPTQENKPTNNSNNIPGQEKKKNEDKSNNKPNNGSNDKNNNGNNKGNNNGNENVENGNEKNKNSNN